MSDKLLWLRMYTEVLSDPKVQTLPDSLFKAWINLLIIAKLNNQKGKLPESIHSMAFSLHLTDEKLTKYLKILTDTGLIDNGVMHGWEKRQYESDNDPTNNARQKRYREQHSNALHNASITPPRVQSTDTDTEEEIKANKNYSQNFLAFYDAYPRKEGKTQAAKTYNAKIKQGVDPAAILASLAVYKAQIVQKHTEPQYIKQPSTFLNCFEDYTPQPVPKMVRPLTFVFKSGKTCPYCKTELPKGGYLCPNCGAGPINAFNGMRDEYFEVLA